MRFCLHPTSKSNWPYLLAKGQEFDSDRQLQTALKVVISMGSPTMLKLAASRPTLRDTQRLYLRSVLKMWPSSRLVKDNHRKDQGVIHNLVTISVRNQ